MTKNLIWFVTVDLPGVITTVFDVIAELKRICNGTISLYGSINKLGQMAFGTTELRKLGDKIFCLIQSLF